MSYEFNSSSRRERPGNFNLVRDTDVDADAELP